MGRDSNPRCSFPHSSFQDCRLSPLGHPSKLFSYNNLQKVQFLGCWPSPPLAAPGILTATQVHQPVAMNWRLIQWSSLPHEASRGKPSTASHIRTSPCGAVARLVNHFLAYRTAIARIRRVLNERREPRDAGTCVALPREFYDKTLEEELGLHKAQTVCSPRYSDPSPLITAGCTTSTITEHSQA